MPQRIRAMFDPDAFHEQTGLHLLAAETLDASAVTRAVYGEWRAPRFGGDNPEVMNNPLWEWLVNTGVSGSSATERFNGPSPFDAGPAWCFDRMGQTCTILPDGRRVFLAGEHEDYYDPDFCIYNDVVIWHPDGQVQILGYPRDTFPPTDFHTATVVNDAIVVIGNLGYPEDRIEGKVQVAVLNLNDLKIRAVETTGEMPSWIHRHKAELTARGDAILVRKGKVLTHRGLEENIHDWRLDLNTWHWEVVTRRNWKRFEVRRTDKKDLRLFILKYAIESPGNNEWPKRLREDGVSLDRKLLAGLYQPALTHEAIPESENFEDEYAYKVRRIKVDGIVVRFVDEDHAIQIVVEGNLPAEICNSIAEHIRCILEKIQNAECELNQI